MDKVKFWHNLKEILNKYKNDIYWDSQDGSIVILNEDNFKENIIPEFYGKKESFTRQLNYHGFRKVKNKDKSNKKIAYKNKNFVNKNLNEQEIESFENKREKKKDQIIINTKYYDDEKHEIVTNKEEVNDLLNNIKLNDDNLKKIFSYIDNDNELYNYEKTQNEIDSLINIQKNLANNF